MSTRSGIGDGRLSVVVPRLISLLSSHLYRSPEAFIRELVCNAHDAIRLRHAMSGEGFAGRIAICGRSGTVTFEDDGCGMTGTELRELLGAIGRSGTAELATNSDTVGRFGIGFLSAFSVARQIRVLTRSMKSREAYLWEWSGGDGFSIEPADRPAPGTTVSVELSPPFADLAEPARLRSMVRAQVPFLRCAVEVGGTDPRDDLMRLATNAHEPADLGDALTSLIEVRDVIRAFRAPLQDGGWAVLGFTPSPGGRTSVWGYQHGVLVNRGVFEPGSQPWLVGVVNAVSGNLTLDRSEFEAGRRQALRGELAALTRAQLAQIAASDRRSFAAIVAGHRVALLHWISTEPDAFSDLGRHYLFHTTVGDLSFLELERKAPGVRRLKAIRGAPAFDFRWGIARGEGALIASVTDADEEQLLRRLCDSSRLSLDILEFGNHPLQPAPNASPQLCGLVERMRRQLDQDQVLVEAAQLGAPETLAVVEYARPRSGAQPSTGTASPLEELVRQARSHYAASTSSAKLLLNAQSPLLERLARTASAEDSPVLAAVLFAFGAARMGVSLTADWLPLVDRLAAGAVAGMIGRKQARAPREHVVCFFAHSFKCHKPVLDALRRVLEHSPFWWQVVSPEETESSPILSENVVGQIQRCDVVVSDLSNENDTSKPNANVLLETGLAIGLNVPLVLLHDRPGPLGMADLRGHLAWSYEPGGFGVEAFDKPLAQYLEGRLDIRALRRPQPYLAYRHLLEARILTEMDLSQLSPHYPDPKDFLADEAPVVARRTGLSASALKRARTYLSERVEEHHQFARWR